MPKENMRDICPCRSNRLPLDLSIMHDQIFGALHFHDGSKNRRKALEVVDSNLREGTHAAIVIPRSPSGSGIPIQSARAVHPPNPPPPTPSPSAPKGGERC